MIRLKPDPDRLYTCPECRSNDCNIHTYMMDGIYVFARCTCSDCHLAFDQVLPTGHTVDYPLACNRITRKEYITPDCPEWLSGSVFKAHTQIKTQDISLERIIYKPAEEVVILNTLDTLYGHVLLKLYNAFYHLDTHPTIGLILIIPSIFTWLIPRGCAEVWIVDLKLSEMSYSYSALQKFFDTQLPRFQTVYMSKAYSHPILGSTDIERLTGISPFKLESFGTQKTIISFILRNDRWWFSHPADYWFYRICRKLKVLDWGKGKLTKRQDQLVRNTIGKLKKLRPDIHFNVTGLGIKSIVGENVYDTRTVQIDAARERAWCHLYASSQVVIGVHGSNMLLPTALAAGCIEILPEDRFGNIVQDLSVRYSDRQQLFFYRFADQFSSPGSIARKAIAMINDYPVFRQNMRINVYEKTS